MTTKTKRKKLTPEERKAKVDAATERLEQGIRSITDSEEFKRYLRFLGSFHSYSANNIMLIHLQNQEARMVAGFHDWRKKGRFVRKGERGITILAPMVGKGTNETTGEEEAKLFGFRTTAVFDVSQTDAIEGAEPLPEPPKPGALDSDEDTSEFFRAIARTGFEKWGCRMFDSVMERFEGEPTLKGVYVQRDHTAYIRPGLPPVHKVKTAVHELVHHILHRDPKAGSRSTFELEAEGTAFAVLDHFGYDASDYSFAYMASWYEDLDGLKAAISVIQKTAHEMIERLEEDLDGIV